jgi:hypothetical protein
VGVYQSGGLQQREDPAGAGLGKLLCCHIDVCQKYYRKYVKTYINITNDIFVSSRVRMVAISAESLGRTLLLL